MRLFVVQSKASIVGAAAALTLVAGVAVSAESRFASAQSTEGGLLGSAPSRGPWYSATSAGGAMNAERVNAFGAWRGRGMDGAITYPSRKDYNDLAGSTWSITEFAGVPGRLIYGLPLIPDDKSGTLNEVASGKWDHVWRKVASDMKDNGRGDSIVRVGWEANGKWFPWGQAAAESPSSFVAAYRHVASVLKSVAPNLVMDFDISCGATLPGQSARLDGLQKLYPGDDVTDIIGCDDYDQFATVGNTAEKWSQALQPSDAPGLADVAAFARAHGKGFAVPEWGVATTSSAGAGDDPVFVEKMHDFMESNRDIMTYEAYYNDTDQSLQSSLWEGGVNPKAAAAYRRLFGG